MNKIVKPRELGRPDMKLRQQLRKLKFSLQECKGTLAELHALLVHRILVSAA